MKITSNVTPLLRDRQMLNYVTCMQAAAPKVVTVQILFHKIPIIIFYLTCIKFLFAMSGNGGDNS